MEVKYFSVNDRKQLDKIIKFDGNYYEDDDLIVDVIGVINMNEPIDLAEGEEDPREPIWSDYIFNVLFKNESKEQRFKNAKEWFPETPIRTFA